MFDTKFNLTNAALEHTYNLIIHVSYKCNHMYTWKSIINYNRCVNNSTSCIIQYYVTAQTTPPAGLPTVNTKGNSIGNGTAPPTGAPQHFPPQQHINHSSIWYEKLVTNHNSLTYTYLYIRAPIKFKPVHYCANVCMHFNYYNILSSIIILIQN